MVVAVTEVVDGPVAAGVDPKGTASAPAESASDAAEDADVGTSAQQIQTDVSDSVTVHAAEVEMATAASVGDAASVPESLTMRQAWF
ncbi:hypothetical protein GN244_ATG18991 [Phytophthora infestans]|uniref:Uncharacterized protein n=1 Tax=Phytophthora infestans TaxID=4787 RepID=A0A833RYT8_PHYIN|nr:hypothetical protein GN244_ATG18991 [Phytophthora infestans]KAF4136372.1 hypothetical protein GN958_ATG14433 [Phytophthora infestans]